MSPSERTRWINAAAFTGVAVLQFAVGSGSVLARWIIPAALLAAAFAASPLRSRPGITHAQARRLVDQAEPGRKPVIVYHRPGCTFCLRLKLALTGVRSKAHWVDVWDDPEGSAYVKSVNEGNETVPTVVIDGTPRTNPPPTQVRAALAGR